MVSSERQLRAGRQLSRRQLHVCTTCEPLLATATQESSHLLSVAALVFTSLMCEDNTSCSFFIDTLILQHLRLSPLDVRALSSCAAGACHAALVCAFVTPSTSSICLEAGGSLDRSATATRILLPWPFRRYSYSLISTAVQLGVSCASIHHQSPFVAHETTCRGPTLAAKP